MTSKRFKLSLFIFRRDLRLQDNTALMAALNESEQVIPCFIFDDRQIKKNEYFSSKAFRFMLESLQDLKIQIEKKNGHFYFFHGQAEKVIFDLFLKLPIDAVYFNRDYTPFSINRDNAIKKVIEKNKRKVFIFSDALLNEPEEVKKSDGSPYTIFTPFMRKSRELFVSKRRVNNQKNYYTKLIDTDNCFLPNQFLENYSEINIYQGGCSNGKILLKNIVNLKNYSKNRDFPYKDATSHLSAHHKFGTISIRETYDSYKNAFDDSVFINELYWRDFFTHIAFHFPRVLGESFNAKFHDIQWSNRFDHFDAWCNGTTGFPIVDAGMRELNQTGLMHNRVRMIAASFLVKDLHIDWRWGEKYFARHLIDYDPAVNNGNWQWAASTGCDAQPYFRIFNPWLQQKRFDTDAEYIKKWVPELKHVPSKDINDPKKLLSYQIKQYPNPIVDHSIENKIAKLMYEQSTSIFKKKHKRK